jgi:hypothetical protein
MTVNPKEEREALTVKTVKKSKEVSRRNRSRRRGATMNFINWRTLTVFTGVRQSLLARKCGLIEQLVVEVVKKCTCTAVE